VDCPDPAEAARKAPSGARPAHRLQEPTQDPTAPETPLRHRSLAEALSPDQRVALSVVECWCRLGRSSRARATLPLWQMVDERWRPTPPVCQRERTIAWMHLCGLRNFAARKQMLPHLSLLLRHIEEGTTQAADTAALARSLELVVRFVRLFVPVPRV